MRTGPDFEHHFEGVGGRLAKMIVSRQTTGGRQ